MVKHRFDSGSNIFFHAKLRMNQCKSSLRSPDTIKALYYHHHAALLYRLILHILLPRSCAPDIEACSRVLRECMPAIISFLHFRMFPSRPWTIAVPFGSQGAVPVQVPFREVLWISNSPTDITSSLWLSKWRIWFFVPFVVRAVINPHFSVRFWVHVWSDWNELALFRQVGNLIRSVGYLPFALNSFAPSPKLVNMIIKATTRIFKPARPTHIDE